MTDNEMDLMFDEIDAETFEALEDAGFDVSFTQHFGKHALLVSLNRRITQDEVLAVIGFNLNARAYRADGRVIVTT